MAETVQILEYFELEVPDKPGEGARLLGQLKEAGVNLIGLTGFPKGRKAHVELIPEDSRAFKAAARKAKVQVGTAHKVFFIAGDDRVGAAADLFVKLGAANINVAASQATAAGGGRFGMLVWVKPEDVRKAARILGAPAGTAAKPAGTAAAGGDSTAWPA